MFSHLQGSAHTPLGPTNVDHNLYTEIGPTPMPLLAYDTLTQCSISLPFELRALANDITNQGQSQ